MYLFLVKLVSGLIARRNELFLLIVNKRLVFLQDKEKFGLERTSYVKLFSTILEKYETCIKRRIKVERKVFIYIFYNK